MALNRLRINVPLRRLVIPLLVFGFPYLCLAALAASKWLVEVKLWQAAVGIDVRKLAVVGWYSRRVMSLLDWTEAQYSLSLSHLFLGGIPASLCVPTHDGCCRLTGIRLHKLSWSTLHPAQTISSDDKSQKWA